MDKAAIELHIKTPRDWGKITLSRFYDIGGGTLLSNYYKNSLYGCLQSVYKGCSQFAVVTYQILNGKESGSPISQDIKRGIGSRWRTAENLWTKLRRFQMFRR